MVAVANPHARARAVKVVREVQRLQDVTGAQHRAVLHAPNLLQHLLAQVVGTVVIKGVRNHVKSHAKTHAMVLVSYRVKRPVEPDVTRVVSTLAKDTAKS